MGEDRPPVKAGGITIMFDAGTPVISIMSLMSDVQDLNKMVKEKMADLQKQLDELKETVDKYVAKKVADRLEGKMSPNTIKNSCPDYKPIATLKRRVN